MRKTAVLLLAAMVLGLFCVSCAREEAPPALGDAEAAARLAELMPDAMRLMQVAYGEGLETVAGGDDELTVGTNYRPVSENAAYRSAAEIRADAEKLFSSAYLKNTLYVLLFDGYTPPTETAKNETVVSDHIDPRYREENGVLCADVNFKSFSIRTEPVPESAHVVSGNDRRVTVEMSYRMDGEEKGTMQVSLVLENGSWLLDGPVY